MNLIEAQSAVLKLFPLTDADDLSHGMRQRRIYRFLRTATRNAADRSSAVDPALAVGRSH